MNKLEINYEVVQECVAELRTLILNYPQTLRPTLLGCGLVIEELNQISNIYYEFYHTIEGLIDATVSYLICANNYLKKFDEREAEKMLNGG